MLQDSNANGYTLLGMLLNYVLRTVKYLKTNNYIFKNLGHCHSPLSSSLSPLSLYMYTNTHNTHPLKQAGSDFTFRVHSKSIPNYFILKNKTMFGNDILSQYQCWLSEITKENMLKKKRSQGGRALRAKWCTYNINNNNVQL